MSRAPLLAALLLLAAGSARAQEAGDTLRADSVPAEAAPARPSRWATPFAVQSTGRPTPHRVQGEVVWSASERTSRRAPAELAETPDTAAADSAPRPPRRAAPRDSTTRPPRTAARDSTARPPRAAAPDTAGEAPAPRRATRPDTAQRRTPPRRDSTAAPRTRPRTHTVAAGETLSGIARRYGVTTAQLRALNPEATADGLETGAVLRLPPAPRATAAATTPAQRPAAARRRTHTVVAGETLYGLSRRYGVTTDALRRANDLGASDGLRAGQTIVIPAP